MKGFFVQFEYLPNEKKKVLGIPKLRITTIKSNCIASIDTQTLSHTHTQFQKIKHKRKKNLPMRIQFQCGKENQRKKNTLNAFPNN